MNSNDDSLPTLYDRIGGAETISRLVDSFYAKVLGDAELSSYFKNAPMLIKMAGLLDILQPDRPTLYFC